MSRGRNLPRCGGLSEKCHYVCFSHARVAQMADCTLKSELFGQARGGKRLRGDRRKLRSAETAIHRAGQLGIQISVLGQPPLDVTELKPSSVTNCLTAIPVGLTPCSMNCSKRLLDAVHIAKEGADPKVIFCHREVSPSPARPKSPHLRA